MASFDETVSLIARTCSMLREFCDMYETPEADAVRQIDSKFVQASTAVQRDRERVNALALELKDKISAAQRVLDQLKSGGGQVGELGPLEKQLQELKEREELLEQETRAIKDELDEVEASLRTTEAKKESLSMLENMQQHNRNELSLYAQISGIMPKPQNLSKVAGNFIDRQGRVGQEFELDPNHKSEFEICNDLWHADM